MVLWSTCLRSKARHNHEAHLQTNKKGHAVEVVCTFVLYSLKCPILKRLGTRQKHLCKDTTGLCNRLFFLENGASESILADLHPTVPCVS